MLGTSQNLRLQRSWPSSSTAHFTMTNGAFVDVGDLLEAGQAAEAQC
jgi:hypothetical protein